MSRPSIRRSFKAPSILALLVVAAAATVSPQQSPAAPREKQRDVAANEEIRRATEKVVREIELEVFRDDRWIKVERIEKALLYYGEPTRDNDRGSVWGWGRQGRPLALLELWQHVNDRTSWAFAICNTSGEKLRASRAGAPWWHANESAAELKDIPDAPIPSDKARPRQRQLKLLAQKFTGHEFWDPNNSRFELRRLERPLHTYRDEAAGVLDGALFTLANGTNPEILFFLEARSGPKGKKKAVWQYAVGRLAHAELHLEYDGKEVFNAPRGDRVAGRNKPYWLDFISTVPAVKREKE